MTTDQHAAETLQKAWEVYDAAVLALRQAERYLIPGQNTIQARTKSRDDARDELAALLSQGRGIAPETGVHTVTEGKNDDDSAALLPGDPSASVKTEALPHRCPALPETCHECGLPQGTNLECAFCRARRRRDSESECRHHVPAGDYCPDCESTSD